VQRQATEAPQTRTPAAPVPTRDVRETRKGERKSLTNEATRGRSSHAALDKATTAGAPQGRKKAASRTDRLESSRRASITDEIDAWPTEVIGGDLGLDRATTETGTTRLPLRTSQALRVKVWKDTEGVVRVSGGGPDVPKGAIDAHLVGLEPDDDLAALF
jgi:hypothetical protein